MTQRQDTEPKKYSWLNPYQIIKTAILSVIVFVIFSGLLMAADPIFQQLIESLLKEAVGRTVWSLLLATVFIGLLSIVLPRQEKKYPELRVLTIADVVVPVGIVVALIGAFLFVQAKYLFASHELFQQFTITYSEYVRKGFSELLIATGIASVLSYIVTLKKNAEGKGYLTWLNILLIVELGLLLASAWKRDLMYIEVYGLTRMRIIGEVFLFWLAGILVLLLLLAIGKWIKEQQVMIGMALLTVAALGYFTLVNMDMRIAVNAPKRDEVKDLFYLANLSADAVTIWEDLVISAEANFTDIKDKKTLNEAEKSRLANTKLALYSLVAQRERLDKKYGDWSRVKKTYRDDASLKIFENADYPSLPVDPDHKRLDAWFKKHRTWQASTLSERHAYTYIDARRDIFFRHVDTLLWSIIMYQKNNGVDLYEQERWILYDFTYPFIDLHLTYRPTYEEFLVPPPTPMVPRKP